MITDEMVEKAKRAYWAMPNSRFNMHASLEAVAPMLMKQGALIVCDLYEARCRIGKAEPWSENLSHMLARAQELDPK